MFQDDIFDEWLDSESQSVLNKFKTNEPLSIEDKMILTLKAQTNHFYHLDQDIRKDISDLDNKTMTAISDLREDTNKRFEQVDKRFEQVDKRFEKLHDELHNIYKAINNQTWKMIGSVGLIVVFSKLVESLPLIKF